MVWDGDQGRALAPEEAEELMGLPRGYTQEIPATSKGGANMARRHAIGNGFHIPSIILLLSLLVSPHTATSSLAQRSGALHSQEGRQAGQQQWAERHSKGTIWDDERLGQLPTRLADALLDEALGLFPASLFRAPPAPEGAVRRARESLRHIDLRLFDNFGLYLTETGAPPTATGPDLQALWAKSPAHAAAGKQHRPSAAAAAMPSLVEEGLGPQQHQEKAQEVAHPFQEDAPIERNLLFAIIATARLGPTVKTRRKRRMKLLRQISEALKELDDHAKAQRHVRVATAPGLAPMMVAYMVVLLAWPDRELPRKLVYGFEIAKLLASSHIYRPIEAKAIGAKVALEEGEELLGSHAATFVDNLTRTMQPSDMARTVWGLTMEEVELGLADPPRPRSYFDERYGRGGWRPLPRHAIWQQNKWRPIDDGRKAHTNALGYLSEAIVCIPSELLILVAKRLEAEVSRLHSERPTWLALRAFLADWWKGYRQKFPTEEHMVLAIVALQHPDTREWQFSQLRGLPFGLGACNNQFGRTNALATAVARRLLYIMAGHYADDTGALDLADEAIDTQRDFTYMMGLLGVKLSESKWLPTASMTNFLGHCHDFSRCCRMRSSSSDPSLELARR
jgi:hypothetical protein